MNMRKTLFLAGALSGVASLMLAGTADASIKCRSTMAKTAAKYVQGYSKILQKCEAGVLAGKLAPGPCPAADPKAPDKIAGLLAKVGPSISKACCGVDKTCGNADDDTGIFTHARCPDVEGVTADANTNCSDNVVQNIDDLSACIACVAAEQVEELNEASHSGFIASTPGSTENKCQVAIGKNTAAFFQTKSKLLTKCRDGQLKGKIVLPCDQDPKTVDGLASAEAKKVAAICKACGGPDKLCGPEECQNTGATIGNACTANSDCNVCSDDSTACTTGESCNVCTAGAIGDPCDADADCRICSAGNVGADCETNGACNVCTGGANNGLPCPIGVIQCPGGTCGGGTCAAAIASSCAGGTIATCGGGNCTGADDLTLAQIGFFPKCPTITDVGVNTNPAIQSLQDIIECVDATASTRGDCADGIGASSQSQILPSACERTIPNCVGNQGPATVSVSISSSLSGLGAVSVGLGYKDSTVTGTGDLDPVTGPVQPTFFNGQIVVNDDERQVILSIVASDPVGDPIPATGLLFTADINKCTGFLSADDISCIVRDAADSTSATVLEGVTCSVTVL